MPPYVVATVPDTFAVVEEGLREFEFKFSERISERAAAGALEDAVVVSPEIGAVRVRHRRDAITVETRQGLLSGRVYRVTVLPVVMDMFDNALRDPFDLVVSTGGEFAPNVVAGVVEDRVNGTAVAGARVEAVFAEGGDTATHWGYSDDGGFYSLRFLPAGSFDLRAWQDRNRDAEAGPREPFALHGGGVLGAADTAYGVLSLVEPDTSAAQLVRASVSDSVTIVFEFDDYLDPHAPGEMIEGVLLPQGEGRPRVFPLFHDHELQAWKAEQADSAGQDAAREEAPPPATGLSGLILPAQTLTGVLAEPLPPSRAYEAVLTGVFNLAGLEARGAKIIVSRDVQPPDSAAAEADETPPDTAQAPPDTVRTPPDTLRVPPDTVRARPGAGEARVPPAAGP